MPARNARSVLASPHTLATPGTPATPATPRSHTVDIDLLRVFDTVVRIGSFTTAAKALSRTQSAVSMQLRRLEEQLGVQLVARGTRQLAPTPEGLQLLPLARQMLGLNDQLFHDVDKAVDKAEVSGSIRIGSIEHYATRVLPVLIAEFCRQHPRIHVELHHGVSSVMHAELGARYDMVIGVGAVGSGEGLRLTKSRIVWASTAASATHLQRPLPLALNPEGAMLRDWATHALDRAGIPWRIAYTSTSVTGLEAAVRAGIAVGVFREATISKRLKILGAKEGMPSLPDSEVWLATVPLPGRKAVELLEAFLIHKLRK
ncbi:DNA-binding transcriptional regulator, LysR family [Variovorax sp. OK605]|uniref:LysR substrate-binding domain-containing protein n=1 Tax=Variovorax sp. OK605 TaxID=1855317 RepID=UPI0008DEBF45|nr:LysR substrate-binding domain-containing protein [Variovorax sp. OK605]SFQ54586.1 DNA-binding transcriptional regulator, LysR family [Variovorax sp. OK605]